MGNDFKDEDGRNITALSRALERERVLYDKWLLGKARQLARAHGIADIDAQKGLLRQLYKLPEAIPSGVSLSPDNWSIPGDLADWKEVRPRLKRLAKSLIALEKLLDELLTETAALSALARFDPMGRLPALEEAVRAFTEIARPAAEIAGQKGRRPHAVWKGEAVRLCRAFWSKHKQKRPTKYFNPITKPKKGERIKNRTTEPANDFSRWFCDLMRLVAGLTPSECDTLLRH